jgi:hypothetical protein
VPPAGGRAAWAVATVVRAGADAPCAPERSSHRLTAVGPRGSRDGQPGGGPAHPDRRWRLLTVCRHDGRAVHATASRAGARCTPIAGGVFPLYVGPQARRHSRLLAEQGPMHPIAGAVLALYGGQRAARDSESARRAGPHLHRQSAAGSRGWPLFTTFRPGPAAGSRVLPTSGPGRLPYSGADSRQLHVPQVQPERRRTPAARQVLGTDSDTSRRRRGRRFRRDTGLPVPSAAVLRRLRFDRDRFICGPRVTVCLDVARPSCLRLPPFPRASCKARDTFTPVQYTTRDSHLQCGIVCSRRSLRLVVVQPCCWLRHSTPAPPTPCTDSRS